MAATPFGAAVAVAASCGADDEDVVLFASGLAGETDGLDCLLLCDLTWRWRGCSRGLSRSSMARGSAATAALATTPMAAAAADRRCERGPEASNVTVIEIFEG